MAQLFRAAACQIDITLKQPQRNLEKMLSYAEAAKGKGAQLAVFPECALSGYCYESRLEALEFAETIPGPATETVASAARRLGIHFVFGLLERDGDHLFNACVLVGPGGVVGKYRKTHVPFLGVDRFVDKGEGGFELHAIGDLKLGMLICYDGNFPEPARSLALQGADLIALPTNWPTGADGTATWITQTRAAENHIYYLAANRVGHENGFDFIGRSKICDPHGRISAQLDASDEGIAVAELDLEWPRRKRIVRVPGKLEFDYFTDRRPELYRKLTE